MSTIPFWLLKKANDEALARRANMSESSRKENEKKNDYVPEYIRNEIERNHFFISLPCYIATQDDLSEFFIKLVEYKDFLHAEELKKIEEEKQSISDSFFEKMQELMPKVLKAQAKVETNVEVTGVDKKELPSYLAEKYGIDYFGFTFNGIKVTSEMLNSGENPYRKQYENWQENNEEIKEKIDALETEVSHLKEKFTLFKKKNNEQIVLLEEKLNNMKSEYEKGQILKGKADIFDAFTENDKANILNYLTSIDMCIDECSNYEHIIFSRRDDVYKTFFPSGTFSLKPEEVSYLVEMAISNDIITKEELENVIVELSSLGSEINEASYSYSSDLPHRISPLLESFYTVFVENELENTESLDKKRY